MKIHYERNGRSICQAEKGYGTPVTKTRRVIDVTCKNCKGLGGLDVGTRPRARRVVHLLSIERPLCRATSWSQKSVSRHLAEMTCPDCATAYKLRLGLPKGRRPRRRTS